VACALAALPAELASCMMGQHSSSCGSLRGAGAELIAAPGSQAASCSSSSRYVPGIPHSRDCVQGMLLHLCRYVGCRCHLRLLSVCVMLRFGLRSTEQMKWQLLWRAAVCWRCEHAAAGKCQLAAWASWPGQQAHCDSIKCCCFQRRCVHFKVSRSNPSCSKYSHQHCDLY
jgi:hypothetical protein